MDTHGLTLLAHELSFLAWCPTCMVRHRLSTITIISGSGTSQQSIMEGEMEEELKSEDEVTMADALVTVVVAKVDAEGMAVAMSSMESTSRIPIAASPLKNGSDLAMKADSAFLTFVIRQLDEVAEVTFEMLEQYCLEVKTVIVMRMGASSSEAVTVAE